MLRSALLALTAALALAARAEEDFEAVYDDDLDTDFSYVTCGSVVKLGHRATSYRLHSHEIAYGSSGQSSGQQSVTAVSARDDSNSLWIVKARHGKECRTGERFKNGATIRLEHVNTRHNLHSHQFRSPLSQNQEVSAFGTDGNGDAGDNWKIEVKTDHWMRGESFKLKHADTSTYLTSDSRYRYQHPISGQQEVFSARSGGSNAEWVTEEGVYYPWHGRR